MIKHRNARRLSIRAHNYRQASHLARQQTPSGWQLSQDPVIIGVEKMPDVSTVSEVLGQNQYYFDINAGGRYAFQIELRLIRSQSVGA